MLTAPTKLLLLAAFVALMLIGACGNTAPTQEEFSIQYFRYDQAGQSTGRCKLAPSGYGPACDGCRNQNCCAVVKACERDQKCSTVGACALDCLKSLDPLTPDPKQRTDCLKACSDATPEGTASYAASSTCLADCSKLCQLRDAALE